MQLASRALRRPLAPRVAAAGRRLSSAASALGTERKVSANGVDLHVVTAGEEQQGTPVVCMCGALGTVATDFAPTLAGLSAGGHQVVSMDPRGYGNSRPPVRDFPIDFYQRDGDDAAGVMEALGHEKFNVVGWSDGAIAAVLLAAKYPERVEKLIIFGGNAYFDKDDVEAFESTRDVSTQWSKRMLETHLPVYGDDLQPMWSSAIDAWIRIIEEKDGDVCIEEARSIKCPTLVAHGEKDPICLTPHAEWFEENIPNARLQVFPGGKHNFHLRFADEFNKAALDFFAEK